MFEREEYETSGIENELRILADENKYLREMLAKMENVIMTKEEVLERFNISQPTLDRWKKNKGFPSHKIGGKSSKIFFIKSEIDAWIIKKSKKIKKSK